MRALVILIVLALCGGVAYAETSPSSDDALAQVKKTEKRRAKLVTARADVSSRYSKELAEIAKLKKQKSSWRRDRQLKAKLKASLETGKTIAQQSKELTAIDVSLTKQRKALVAAIDAELAGAPSDARAKTLRTLRAEVAAKVAPKKAKKIVLPDDELDPLADPDELDAQAKALRAGEDELQKQIASLDRQAKRFEKQAELRKEHARADELASRDDEQPRRTSGSGGGAGITSDMGASPEDDSDSPPPDDGGGVFEGDPAVVLADVVDGDTVDAIRKAERSSDPKTKAAAAARAKAAVQKRLDKLAKRRKEIEQRARQLRE